MPYGVRRGLKVPGEFGVGDIAGLALAGSAGIIAALVTDYQQSAESSALYTLNRWAISAGSIMGFDNIPLFAVILGLVVMGAASVFYFQPITRQGAFAQGFGLLAVVMTAIPSDLSAGIEDILNDDNLPGLSASLTTPQNGEGKAYTQIAQLNDNANKILIEDKARFSKIRNDVVPSPQSPTPDQPINAVLPIAVTQSATPSANATAALQTASRVAQYRVHLEIKFIGGFPNDVETLIRRGGLRGRLHNQDTGETFNIFRNAGGVIRYDDETIVVDAGVPARADNARLWIRIECDDHKIEQQSAVARLGETLKWKITVKETKTPMFLQRLNQVYWF